MPTSLLVESWSTQTLFQHLLSLQIPCSVKESFVIRPDAAYSCSGKGKRKWECIAPVHWPHHWPKIVFPPADPGSVRHAAFMRCVETGNSLHASKALACIMTVYNMVQLITPECKKRLGHHFDNYLKNISALKQKPISGTQKQNKSKINHAIRQILAPCWNKKKVWTFVILLTSTVDCNNLC